MPTADRSVETLCGVLLAAASRIVPGPLRGEWRREWEAEVCCRLHELRSGGRLDGWARLDLVARCLGAWRHAGLLRADQTAGAAAVRETRLAVRLLGRTPRATGLLISSVGIGLALVTVSLGIVASAWLRPLPYRDGRRTVTIFNRAPEAGLQRTRLSDLEFFTFRRDNRTLTAFAAYRGIPLHLAGPAGGRDLLAAAVTPDFFGLVDATPALGRWLEPADTGGARPVVLGHQLWRDWYGADPGIVGRTIQLDDAPSRVVGVAAAGFGLPLGDADLWVPLRLDPEHLRPGARMLGVTGLMRAKVTADEAAADLTRISLRLQRERPEVFFGGFGAGWDVAAETPARSGVRQWSPVVGLVVGGAGVTLATLLGVASAAAGQVGTARRKRRRSIGVALAVLAGAGIGLLGAGLLGAPVGNAVLPWMDVGRTGLDLRVSLAAAVLGLLVTLGLTIAPAQRGRVGWTRRLLRVLPFAGVTLLAAGAGLAAAVWQRVGTAAQLDPDGVVVVPGPRAREGVDALVARLALGSGVEGVAITSTPPVITPAPAFTFDLEGRDQRPGEPPTSAGMHLVGGGYFGLLRIRFAAGRGLDGSADEIVVNRAMAERFWPGAGAVGRRVRVYLTGERMTGWLTVVGVAGDVRHDRLVGQAAPEFYLPAVLDRSRVHTILVRTRDRARVEAVTGAPVVTLSASIDRAALPYRQAALALGIMSALAVGMVCATGRLLLSPSGRLRGAMIGIGSGALLLWVFTPAVVEALGIVGESRGRLVLAAAMLGVAVSIAAALSGGWAGEGTSARGGEQ